jgi:hypothetical protein
MGGVLPPPKSQDAKDVAKMQSAKHKAIYLIKFLFTCVSS